MDWFAKSLVAVLFLIPIFFAAPFYDAHYGVKSEVTAIFWFFGVIVGIGGWLIYTGNGTALAIRAPILEIMVLGLVFGATANIMLFQAFVDAPSPGLPVAIMNTNAVIAYLLTPLLVAYLPRHFGMLKFASFDKVDFAALVTIIVCVGIIGLRR